jgi:hypothetical protein
MQGENPNAGELAALTGHAQRKAQATGGAREPAPAPSDAKAEHDALVVEYLSTLPPAGGGGEW